MVPGGKKWKEEVKAFENEKGNPFQKEQLTAQ